MINEYSAANCDNDGGDCGDYDDWIEIFNNSSEAIDLQGYYLSDKIGNLTKWQFPEELIINPNSHIVIYASGLDPSLGTSSFNTSFKTSPATPEPPIPTINKSLYESITKSVEVSSSFFN